MPEVSLILPQEKLSQSWNNVNGVIPHQIVDLTTNKKTT